MAQRGVDTRMAVGLRDAFRHMEWADASVWRSVLALGEGADEPLLRGWLFHIHFVQGAFLAVWRGEAVDLQREDGFESLRDMEEWARGTHRAAAAFLEETGEGDLSSQVAIPWAHYFEEATGKAPAPATLGETMFQVVAHSAYHRGQVNRRLRELGGEPPLVDFIVWTWMGKPEPAWPAGDREAGAR